jgi:hypothetical protein
MRFQNGILLPFSPQYFPRLNEQVGQAFISKTSGQAPSFVSP